MSNTISAPFVVLGVHFSDVNSVKDGVRCRVGSTLSKVLFMREGTFSVRSLITSSYVCLPKWSSKSLMESSIIYGFS